MAENKVFINQSKGPLMLKDAKGAKVRIAVGETIELDAAGMKSYAKVDGLIDLSKMVRPAGDQSAALLKEIAGLKAQMAVLEKDNAQLKEDLEISKM